MKKSNSTLLLLATALLFQACTITNEGPRGPRGNDGVDGVQIYSSTSTIFADDFDIVDEYVSINEFEWDLLDESTVDEGLVLGYLQFEGTTSWHEPNFCAMPSAASNVTPASPRAKTSTRCRGASTAAGW